MILIDRTAPRPSQAPQNPSADAARRARSTLDARLGSLTALEDRIRAISDASSRAASRFRPASASKIRPSPTPSHETGAKIDIFTLDTGRHFPETYDTLFETEGRYGLKIRVMYPDATELEDLVESDGIYGFRYSVDSRKACCDIRKVRPLNRALAGASGWITGLRRDQSQGRAHVPFAAYDGAQNLIKLNPIADWTLDQLEAYVAANKIPVNALHAQGFPSIGCQPCTRAIKPGEDIRAGRWWWENENGKECGLHSRQQRR